MSTQIQLDDETLRVLVEEAPDGIVLVDQGGRIAYANRQANTLFGYEPDGLRGQRVEVLLPESKRAMHVIHREIYLERPETRPMGTGLDLHGRRKDGSTFPVEISLSPLRTASGRLGAAVV